MTKRVVTICVLLATALFFSGTAVSFADNVWQYSVPAPSIDGRRAFLWISPDCKRVRGVIVACQNMLERPLFERPAFREAAAQNGLAILLIDSGHDRALDDGTNPNHPKRSSLDIMLNPNYPSGSEDPQGAGTDLQNILNALADESGYSELRYAPIMPVGHSSAGSFVWHLYRWDPSRIFAMMPFKTAAKSDGPQGIPIFTVNSEWFDYGPKSNNCSTNTGEMKMQLAARGNGDDSLYGYYIDIGAGHCNVSDDSMKLVALFLKKAVSARIPINAPIDGPITLKPVSLESGWLLDAATLGQPGDKPVVYADYKGDPKQAFWYLDRELATAVQNHMQQQYAKKPQQINFFTAGNPPSMSGGTYNFSPKFLDDGETFQVQATYISSLANSDLFPAGTTLTNSGMPIYYRVNSGALEQVGPNTFRIRLHAGPIFPQGNPWEPTLVAYTLGNDEYQPTERPAHVDVSIINKQGSPQTINFPTIADMRAGNAVRIPLAATASSGLPVEYFMVAGPAEIGADGKSLRLLPIPVRSKYPVKVTVGAFQWGRSVQPQMRSADSVFQEFLITR